MLVRHGETSWTLSGQHTSRTDLPLTDHGRAQARLIGRQLAGRTFALVLVSPMRRARETCELAGVVGAIPSPDLVEWDYGEYEGLLTDAIRSKHPGWSVFRDGAPGGETAAQVAARALAALDEIRRRHEGSPDPVLAVSHKATIRILGAALTGAPIRSYRARWAQDESALNLFELRTGKEPFLRLWNDTAHLGPDPAISTRAAK